MPVSRKTLRTFTCAAAAVALATFGTLAQATFYGGDFDPPVITGHFTGHFIVNDVNDQCLAGNSEGCRIDLISLVITNSGDFGFGDFSTGQTNIASSVSFVGGLHFLSVPIPLTSLDDFEFASAGFGSLAPAVTCSPCVMFTPDIGGDFLHHNGFIADLGLFDSNNQFISGDTAIYRIPEPGSLGLLVGGVGAAWLTRRRKTTA
jgi:hypothetical protein